MEIGVYLKKLRMNRGKSVYALAKESGISENHIHRIEKGISQPSVSLLEKLLQALGITLSEFFGQDAEILYPSTFEKELIQATRQLDNERAETILHLVKLMSVNKEGKLP
ncbi:helix-turn-helix transcriptional regulator [Clostridium sp. D33t1_170424_F3]|uniref:helix-turn-helix domain-containing protein n=1 Tax=Clostridium sp. D33t1_170424_F3 TaxID=2787099 RepID=UPI0018AA2A3B|nr:helix-turn-helix transcriptional regulator [Clostridium sp. D33t1_170424_F3]